MVSPEKNEDSDSSDIQCEEDLIILDEILSVGPSSNKKKKRKKKKKSKKPPTDVSSTPDSGYIVLDSTGFSPQLSDKDKERKVSDSTNKDVSDCSSIEKIDSGVEMVTPARRKNSLLALFETPQNINCDDLFQIDTTPSTKDFVAVPKYRSKFEADEVLTGEKKPVEEKKKPRGGPMCWNCGCEGHQIRDCKQRRNPMMINKFRMEMQAKKAFRLSQTRYHEDESSMYGMPIPGEPSQKLREAMGLSDNQLPEYIYRMRVLGYPPGWLEEAKVRHSGISLLDSSGQPVSDPNDEEGEVVGQGERDQFDLNKLVEFPGFNVPPPKNILDESEAYRVPPIQFEHSLENLIARLKPKAVTAYRKRRRAMQQLDMVQSANGDESDCDYMETEEIQDGEELPPDSCKFVPCPPPEEPPVPPPPPSTDQSHKGLEPEEEEGEVVEEQTEEKSEPSSRSQSPSLTQLEKYKNELLSQLNTTSSSGAHRTPVAALGKVKSMEQGTPVLKLSPYQQLPSFDKFQKNVSDVINFENLPDSTGKYKKLIPLLHKVKNVVSKINDLS